MAVCIAELPALAQSRLVCIAAAFDLSWAPDNRPAPRLQALCCSCPSPSGGLLLRRMGGWAHNNPTLGLLPISPQKAGQGGRGLCRYLSCSAVLSSSTGPSSLLRHTLTIHTVQYCPHQQGPHHNAVTVVCVCAVPAVQAVLSRRLRPAWHTDAPASLHRQHHHMQRRR